MKINFNYDNLNLLKKKLTKTYDFVFFIEKYFKYGLSNIKIYNMIYILFYIPCSNQLFKIIITAKPFYIKTLDVYLINRIFV